MTDDTASPPADIPAPNPAPHPVSFAMPPGAWDTHFHVIDRSTGLVPDRSYTPHDATLQQIHALHGALGIQRRTFVQVSVHGTDNRALLAALAADRGEPRGIAVVDETITEAALAAMHDAGVRGVRINVLFGGGVGFRLVESLARRIAPLGWHMQFLMDVSAPDVPWPVLEGLPVPMVIDHMGHMDVRTGLDHPGFQRMLALVREGPCWVKLSGAERISAQKAVPFDDVIPVAHALLEAGPTRCVWGSDWPHVKMLKPMPNDGDLLNQMSVWAPDEALRRAVLVDNPARLYG